MFPFAAAFFKLLKQAKHEYIPIENIVDIIGSFTGILEIEQPLNAPQINALVSYGYLFKCNDYYFDDAACQIVIDALIRNIGEDEDDEGNREIFEIIETFFLDAQFLKRVTITPENLFQLATCGNIRLTEITGKYILKNKSSCVEVYAGIIEAIISSLPEPESVNALAIFIKNCGSDPLFVPIAYEACEKLAEAAASNDSLFKTVINAATSVLSDKIQEFIDGKEPVGIESAAEFCRAATKCHPEFAAGIVVAIAPLLAEAMSGITVWDTKSEEVNSVIKFHRQFFFAVTRCSNIESAAEAAFSIASTIKTHENVSLLVEPELNFLTTLPPTVEIIEFALTFAEASEFSTQNNWRKIMRIACEYLSNQLQTNAEVFMSVVSSLGEKGELMKNGLLCENQSEGFSNACIELHNTARNMK
jgi:hypothetical protein